MSEQAADKALRLLRDANPPSWTDQQSWEASQLWVAERAALLAPTAAPMALETARHHPDCAWRLTAECNCGVFLPPSPDAPAEPVTVPGRAGGRLGGLARARALTPERRREIAIKAAVTRWAKRRAVAPVDDLAAARARRDEAEPPRIETTADASGHVTLDVDLSPAPPRGPGGRPRR